MLSTDIKPELIINRIERVVSMLMEEYPIFKEDLNSTETVQHLVKLFQKNLPLTEFNHMTDSELKEYCDGIMSIKILSKIGEDFTPEQMAIFDDAVKRK